jgi:hypothetical protein
MQHLLRPANRMDSGCERGQEDSGQVSKDNLCPDGCAWRVNLRCRRRDCLNVDLEMASHTGLLSERSF